MKKLCAALMAAAVRVGPLLVGPVGTAAADTATEPGTSDIKKMVVDNGANAVVVKLHGTGGRAAVRWVNVKLKGANGVSYTVQGAWYSVDWVDSLERGQRLVACDGLRIHYRSGYWQFRVPRTCLGRLTDQVKVSGLIVSPTSAIAGEAGPTGWVRRG